MVEKKLVSKFEIFIMFILVGIIPFLMKATNYNLPTPDGAVQMFDYFNFIKVSVIKIVALLILLNFLADLLINDNNKKLKSESYLYRLKNNIKMIDKKIICASIVFLSVILSYIFSDYKEIASFGTFERFEGIWTHFSYIIIFLFSLRYFQKKDSFRYFSYAVLTSTFIVGGIGTLQFLGVDVFSSSLIKELTYKKFDIQIVSEGSFTTMYNINTSASYSLLMMFMLSIIILLNKNKYVRALACLDFILIFVTFFNSMSEASFVSAILGIISIVIIYVLSRFINGNKKKLKIVGISFGALVSMFLVFAISFNLPMKVLDKITPTIEYVKWEQKGNELYFYNKEDNYIKVVTYGDTYEIYENENLLLEKKDNEVIDTTLTGEFFDDVRIIDKTGPNGENMIVFDGYYYIQNDATNPLIVNMTSGEVNKTAEYIGFENYPNAITNRGYIWSRSIPLLLESPIVGHGSDTFFEIFPNDDLGAKGFVGMQNIDVDKPHSIYLNMAINNGLIYLVGFLGVVCLVLYDKFKLLFEFEGENYKRIAIIVYISGIFAYLVNGLSTDNLVVIVMTFWIYLAVSNSIFEDKKTTTISTGKTTKLKPNKVNENSNILDKSKNTDDSKTFNNTEIKKNDKDVNYDEIGINYHDIIKNSKDE